MSARTTVEDLEWLRLQLAGPLAALDPVRADRLEEWAETAIRVRHAQATRSGSKAHDELMEAYAAAVLKWRADCEQEAVGHAGDVAIFRAAHPMPTFRAFLVASRRSLGSNVCPTCGTPLDELAE